MGGEKVEYLSEYRKWVDSPYIDEYTKKELWDIENNEEEIRDRFCAFLEFGTAGLRGLMGAGVNRMNVYTVGRAALGLANYIKSQGQVYADRGVVIAYDSRRFSFEFALRAALVLCAGGVKVHLFDDIRPTPLLSYAVRHLNTTAGIVVTASHNPPEYNGFKVYWEDGGQIIDDRAESITKEILGVCDICEVPVMDRERALREGLLVMAGEEIDRKYTERVLQLCLDSEMIREKGGDLRIVYTPLHGTGYRPVTTVLAKAGFTRVETVKEQREPHSDFPTVRSPNPEDREALELAINVAVEGGAELVVATDPDADRVGIAVRNKEGAFETFTGNQVGVLLAEYILSRRKEKGLSSNGDTIIKTIVTSEMGRAVASAYGVDTIDTLTGFKYIAERMEEFSRSGERRFVFGYEESNGYLAGDFVRDKDGVIATLMVCEMALFYKLKGLTLSEVLEDLYQRHGYYLEDVVSIRLEGCEGLERIGNIMSHFRNNIGRMEKVLGEPVEEIRDYLQGVRYDGKGEKSGKLDLPVSDVLYFRLKGNSWVCIRPSGTEPKLKVYFSVTANSREEALQRLKRFKVKIDSVMQVLVTR
jgi:phosphoglucomutase